MSLKLPKKAYNQLIADIPCGFRMAVLGTRLLMRKQDQHFVMVKNLRMRDKRDTHTERERGTKNKLYSRRQQLQMTTTTTKTTITFTKVTRSLYIVTNLGQLPFMLFT